MPLIRFLAIYALNFFRIGFQTVAIAWFATLATGRVSAVAELLLVSSVSTLCMSPIIGRLVDSISRKKVLLCLGQFSVFFFGLIATCILRFAPFIAPFFVLSFFTVLLSGASLLASGAMDYFLRTFISDEIRARQLARINTVNQISLIAGTCIAGAAAAAVSVETGFLVISLLAGFTTVLCVTLLCDLCVDRKIERKRRVIGLFQASIYFNHPLLFYVACSGALVYSIGQVTNMLLPSLIAFHLHLSSIEYSSIETAWSVGALGVSVSLAIFKTKIVRPLGFELIIISAMSLILGSVPFASLLPVLVAMHLVLGAAFAFVRIRMETRFLQECPVHLLGRFRANSMALTSLMGILVYFVPLINPKASIPVLYLSVASALLFVTLTVFTASASIASVGSRSIRE